jgi:hypothetical protein
MKRREALKNIGFATGFFVATPTVMSLLQSCNTEIKTWIPEFLTQEQGAMLTKLVDIILPKTDLPSATELNVPQFIDKYVSEVLEKDIQVQVTGGFDDVILELKESNNMDIEEISEESYKSILDKYLLVKGEIDKEWDDNPDSEIMTKSEFLNGLKNMCITAYLNTEEIGENVLKYDPIPSQYYCEDLQELTGGISYSPSR